ncbi:glycoside hydrolase family 5 protein [Sphingobium bisphenolivorans]|uniref:glycoside hydrolase family 5 protein n=1 Tax=Sphingobium bisphenolivorans TaxID=1335760 RepID=UPI00039F9D90|nr:glycoside hydrolase family 5 protein [Sphingobium bisphenolivorans]
MTATRAILIACLGAALLAPTQVPAAPPLSGINLAGGEFNASRRPGVYAKDYVYPDARVAKPFIDMGMKIVRVPVLWERLQPVALQPLSDAELHRFDKALEGLRAFDVIIIDIHNYGKWQGRRLDQIDGGERYLADLWRRLAERYKGDRKIAFGLMNEPNGMSPAAWFRVAQPSVIAIRKAGATNLILVPGSKWTGAHSWTTGRGGQSNAASFAGFRDPASNYAVEMHQYLDQDSSGTKMNCLSPDVARQRLEAATAWLRANGHRGFLGEFGVGADEQCLKSLNALLDYLHTNADAWMGWTYWAGGGWWGTNYPMSAQPVKGAARPQSAILARYSGKGATRR